MTDQLENVKDRYAHIEFQGVPFPVAQRLTTHIPLDGSCPPAGEPLALTLTKDDYLLLEKVLETISLPVNQYRIAALARRIPACLRALRVETSQEAINKLDANQAWYSIALDALLIGVTEFFRDDNVFDVLQMTIIPDILARRPNCRVLSLACSDGSELYSIAILLARMNRLAGSELLGVDCRPTAIDMARSGWFNKRSLEKVPAGLRQAYFQNENSMGAFIDPSLSHCMRWQVGDVLNFESDRPWDLILCRNMAIYLTSDVAQSLWCRVSRFLASDGYLVVGKAERPSAGLERVISCIYRKIT